MTALSTALVLSSYNGADYIIEQLDSLRMQDVPFDEVLIGDDCSTDCTASIISDYISRYGLCHWKLVVNETNKGWKKNFRDLIYSVSSDLIFLCDQDDIWLPEKASSMARLMESHPEFDLLACDVEPFYEDGSKQVPNVADGANDGTLSLHPLDDKAVYVLRPGCAYCVRKSFVDEVRPYWNDSWAHDTVLWELAEAKGTLALYDKRLVKFRRHSDNASARKRLTRESRVGDIEDLADRADLLRSFALNSGTLTQKDARLLNEIDNWLEARIRLLTKRSLRAFKLVFEGRKHYATSNGLPVDLLLAFFGRI